MTKSYLIFFWRVFILFVCITLWGLLAYVFEKIEFFIGSPISVTREMLALFSQEPMFRHIFSTAGAALVGLVIGTSVGALSGLMLWRSTTLAKVLNPFLIALGSFPILALAPLMILWFGVGFKMKVAMASFTTIFVALSQAYRGANLVAEEYVAVLSGMQADKSQIFHLVIVPGSVDWVLGSFRINVGLALLGAFIGEFIASEYGLGHLILRASSLYNVPRAIAAAFLIVLLAFLLDGVGRFFEARRYVIAQLLSVPEILLENNKWFILCSIRLM